MFVGNLPFTVKDESLWSIFAICGEVTSVRCVRDQATSIGKGFAYVEFRDRSSVSLALELNGSEHIGRKLRVTKCAQEGTVPKGRKEKSATANGGKGSKSAKSAASAPLDQKKPLRKTFEGERAGKIKLKHKSSSSGGGGKFKKGSSMRK